MPRRLYILCVPNGNEEWLVDLHLCAPNGKEECLVVSYIIYVVPLMEKKSGSQIYIYCVSLMNL